MIKFAFFNANGLHGKADKVLDFVAKEGIDITFLVETWLSKDASSPISHPILNVTRRSDEILMGGVAEHKAASSRSVRRNGDKK